MIVNTIASANVAATTLAEVNRLSTFLAPTYPLSPEWQASACWADDLKASETLENVLHFIDLPVIHGDVPNVPNPINGTFTLPYALSCLTKTLSSSVATDLDKARAVRFVGHFVGDGHQPLHDASLFSTDFPAPEGDVGGNLFKIQSLTLGGSTFTQLHALWDSGVGLWAGDLTRPLNATGFAYLSSTADSLQAAYPRSSFAPQLAVTDFWSWSEESNALAASFVYTAPSKDEGPISQAYITAGQAMASSQVALAGYRLAQVLDAAFANVSPKHNLRGSVASA